jgi:hypothetical protein
MPRQDIIREVSAENVRRNVEHITPAIPSRLAGSPNARRMAEYSLKALHEAGAEARIQELSGLVSFPKKGNFGSSRRVRSRLKRTHRATVYRPCRTVPSAS